MQQALNEKRDELGALSIKQYANKLIVRAKVQTEPSARINLKAPLEGDLLQR